MEAKTAQERERLESEGRIRAAHDASRRLSARWLLDGAGFNLLRLALDSVMLVLAVIAAVAGAHAAHASTDGEWLAYCFPLVVILLMHLRGMYRTRLRVLILDGIVPVVSAVSLAAMVFVAAGIFTGIAKDPGPLSARLWLFGLVYVGAGRVLLAVTQRQARSRGALGRPTLIIGAGAVAAHVARRLEETPEYGLQPIGFLDDDPPPAVTVADRRAPVLGSPSDLRRIAAETGAGHVILSFTREADASLVPLVRLCDELGLEVSIVPRMYESINERVALEHVGGLPLLGLRSVDPKGWQFDIKHAFDRVTALVMLVVIAPVLLAIALAIRITSPGPTMFRQRRVGRDGQAFDLLKFRSMRLAEVAPAPAATAGADEQPTAAADGFRPEPGMGPGGVEGVDRRTRVGRFIRRTSLDELPQLLNVLKGDMSLVGPRPERPEFVSLFREDIDRYSDRHRVKSGITGWAQVHGYRGQTSLHDRVEWDNFYIENWSLYLDVKILLLTVTAVFRSGEE
jgi:exopolysaccharide biosynthesis polyprenyl glycosylphosphotransferase